MFKIYERVEYYPGCWATVVAIHEYAYGIVYDLILERGAIPVSHWRA